MKFEQKELAKRYRMKKKLQLEAVQILNSWQLEKMSKSSRTPREIKAALDKIVALPFNWTEKQYTDAKRELSLFKYNLYLESNADLQKDIEIIKKNPVLSKRSTQKMKKAYSAVIQTLELATNDVLDEATAILQVMRFLGRKIAKLPAIPESDAAAFCLATLPKSYVKPEWLASYMGKIVENNCKNIKIIHMVDEKPVN